ncbi:aminotransferase class I/II-fold pyridoxal phosphate-dependent enzyme [Nitrososphaera viennensis]|uniref:8-amino-7-oxononanoate synthase n=2 Tax=Nitrososphaera viennensis TaxID=1034015 RepID=A0A060HD66_9ARCH|nr:pyridoxal phosphate-dependent aminotransferase family protein [Nitrososphaera viennensis]AIC14679.1 8-amino-7-oxononanoate synthase [Nitrososphaera viennensis EN76]UVS69642.1 pyridoxal phosphate-dependent aminotransferase family protein [Nitrososphaera viennensis]
MASKQNKTTLFVDEKLLALEKDGLYRSLKTVSVSGPLATVNGRKAIHLCSNDYLGLSQDKRVVQAAVRTLRQVSQCSSRLIAGNDPFITKLEDMLARHRRTESALVYPTGYAANLGAVTALADKNTTIFSDELNHASIIDACKLSGARIEVFAHNDTAHLENLVSKAAGRKIAITEGIFSMDGDSADIVKICRIAEKYDALTIVDDAHGDFIFGPKFAGVPAKFGAKVDVHISSMSKGLGCFGGYVATSAKIRELLVNTSRQFIYTSALPDYLCAAAVAAVPLAKRGNLQKRLFENIRQFSSQLKKHGFTLGNSSSQIMPVMVGDEKKAVTFSEELLKNGVFAQAVRYPTVKRGSARLRVSLTAMHEKMHIDAATAAFEKAGRKTGII